MAATQTWEDSEFGAYQRALNCQADQGHLLERDLKKILNTSWDRVQDPTQNSGPKFIKDKDGRYYNKRLEKVLKERQNFLLLQAKKAAKRWYDSDKPLSSKHIECDAGALPGDMPKGMPDACTRVGNGNVNNNLDLINKNNNNTRPNWYTDQEEYHQIESAAYNHCLKNQDIKKKFISIYPNGDFERTLLKCREYWSSTAGWEKKKEHYKKNHRKNPDADIDMVATYRKSLMDKFNIIYRPRNNGEKGREYDRL